MRIKNNKKLIIFPILLVVAICCFWPQQMLAGESTTPSLPNPLGGGDVDIIEVLLRIMQIALAVVDIFALFMFILGGIQFLISAGNPNMVKKAKDTLVWATIGILVITLSYTVLKYIFENVAQGLGA